MDEVTALYAISDLTESEAERSADDPVEDMVDAAVADETVATVDDGGEIDGELLKNDGGCNVTGASVEEVLAEGYGEKFLYESIDDRADALDEARVLCCVSC